MGKEGCAEDLRQVEESRKPPYLGCQENHLKDLHLWMTTQEAAEYSGYDIEHVRPFARPRLGGGCVCRGAAARSGGKPNATPNTSSKPSSTGHF